MPGSKPVCKSIKSKVIPLASRIQKVVVGGGERFNFTVYHWINSVANILPSQTRFASVVCI